MCKVLFPTHCIKVKFIYLSTFMANSKLKEYFFVKLVLKYFKIYICNFSQEIVLLDENQNFDCHIFIRKFKFKVIVTSDFAFFIAKLKQH